MAAHRWLTKRHSSLLSRACSTEGSCGSPSSRDRRRHHVLGRPRRRGAAPRRILRWLDRRRAHPWLSTRGVSGKASHAARTQPSARHHPRAGTSRRVGALVRLIPGGGREVSENLGWKCRRHGLVAPSAAGQRHAAPRPTCDLCPSYSPQILPCPGSPGTASGEPRQVCSISDKFIPPERRSSAVRRPRTGRGTGQVWILHGAAVYLRAHGAFRGVPEACRLRGAAIARRRRLCRALSHRRHGHSVCVQCVHCLRRP